MNDIRFRNNAEKNRYELLDGEQLVGIAEYRDSGDAVALVHTEIFDAYAGNGHGSTLARQTLDDLRRENKRVVPRCSFMVDYIARHPEYRDMLAADR
jgi:predicted GNAT family acetyltransferase